VNADDMLSLRNFYVNIITFWSSQGDLSSKKTEEKGKTKSWHVWSKTWHDLTRHIALFLR